MTTSQLKISEELLVSPLKAAMEVMPRARTARNTTLASMRTAAIWSP
jgi:hypothetical protein